MDREAHAAGPGVDDTNRPPRAPRVTPEGTTFFVTARDAPRVFLLLDDRVLPFEDGELFVPDVRPGQHYAFAVDPALPLVDPHALLLDRSHRHPSVVAPPVEPIAWQRPGHELADAVIYELHVRGFTMRADVAHPGTYGALGERARYLRDLGVTTVELLPVHEFDETENHGNYWGYSSWTWFAPNRRYAITDPIAEFRAMVQALHAHDIEVVLDVVYNHTAEQDAAGPVLHLKALDFTHAYEPADRTGCGNTVNLADPVMMRMVLDSLRWWHHGMGVDGFRFDLATVLSDELIRAIETDPALRDAHLITEPWDAGGGYRVGDWPGHERWVVWNDRYRDDVRRFWLEENHGAGLLATRLSGSSDLFSQGPPRSLNFISAHDGFTLRDMVSYDEKHNLANGEQNRDGRDHEPSWNHGVEGETDDPAIRAARARTQRNLLATLLLSQGVPMLVAGDERDRTQGGNNNPYNQDNETSWLDWSAGDPTFVKELIALRRSHRVFRRRVFKRDEDVDWFGPEGAPADWDATPARLGYHLKGERACYVAFNRSNESCRFALPAGRPWRLRLTTGEASIENGFLVVDGPSVTVAH
ncbi:MAG: alpha-amylase family glycosyl hydrolase [Planctomycetota bacterium]